jgi:hypothetical protein
MAIFSMACHGAQAQRYSTLSQATDRCDQLMTRTKPDLKTDFRKYYDVERYLFDEVGPLFRKEGTFRPEDLFLILIWKANRAKKRHLKRLIKISGGSYRVAVSMLSHDLSKARSPKARLQVLMATWKFRLPTATAILSVLYPDEFSVYDYRVCGELKRMDKRNDFRKLANWSSKSAWAGYLDFLDAVRKSAPAELSLRDKDRWFWGQSLYREVMKDIGQ